MRGVTASATVIIVCGAGFVSGKEIVSLSLARGLRDAGWNVEFVTSQWGDGEFVRRLEQDGFKYQRLRIGFISASLRIKPLMMTLDQMRYWPALACGYVCLVAAAAPRAVIHTNWHHALLLMPFLNSHRDIFWVHEIIPNTQRYRLVFRGIAKRVNRIVCVSRAVAHSILALGVPQSRIMIVYNGVPRVGSMPRSTERGTLQLGIVGQIGPWKGHEDLLDALALLARDAIRFKLRIFGAGNPNYVASLKRKMSNLNLENEVEWCGFVSDQSRIFADVDVCVVPSRSEDPLPTAALEAGAFGRPVIGSSRGGLPEIVEQGVTGFLVEPQRVDQLAQAIKTFACQPNLLNTMGEAARKRVEAEFSIDSFVNQFIAVIEEIAGERVNKGITSHAP